MHLSGSHADSVLVRIDKEHIVEKGNYLKFTKSKDEDMKRKLLETQDRELVEVSPPSSLSLPSISAQTESLAVKLRMNRLPRPTVSGVSATGKKPRNPTESNGVRTCWAGRSRGRGLRSRKRKRRGMRLWLGGAREAGYCFERRMMDTG